MFVSVSQRLVCRYTPSSRTKVPVYVCVCVIASNDKTFTVAWSVSYWPQPFSIVTLTRKKSIITLKTFAVRLTLNVATALTNIEDKVWPTIVWGLRKETFWTPIPKNTGTFSKMSTKTQSKDLQTLVNPHITEYSTKSRYMVQ